MALREPSTDKAVNGSVEAATFIRATNKDRSMSKARKFSKVSVRKIGEPTPRTLIAPNRF